MTSLENKLRQMSQIFVEKPKYTILCSYSVALKSQLSVSNNLLSSAIVFKRLSEVQKLGIIVFILEQLSR